LVIINLRLLPLGLRIPKWPPMADGGTTSVLELAISTEMGKIDFFIDRW